jgi:hypothetical protein
MLKTGPLSSGCVKYNCQSVWGRRRKRCSPDATHIHGADAPGIDAIPADAAPSGDSDGGPEEDPVARPNSSPLTNGNEGRYLSSRDDEV